MTLKYGAWALHARLARLHAYAPGYLHARTHARARMHTPTNKLYLLLFHGNNASRERLIVTLYVYCLSCYFVQHLLSIANLNGQAV
jgi:hypothetical protein